MPNTDSEPSVESSTYVDCFKTTTNTSDALLRQVDHVATQNGWLYHPSGESVRCRNLSEYGVLLLLEFSNKQKFLY